MTDSNIRFAIFMATVVAIVLIGCVTSVLNTWNRSRFYDEDEECGEELEGDRDVPGALPVRADR